MKIYLYLHADGAICRDQAKKPILTAEQVGAARLVNLRKEDVIQAIARLPAPFPWAEGELARRGYYLHEYADGSFEFAEPTDEQDE